MFRVQFFLHSVQASSKCIVVRPAYHLYDAIMRRGPTTRSLYPAAAGKTHTQSNGVAVHSVLHLTCSLRGPSLRSSLCKYSGGHVRWSLPPPKQNLFRLKVSTIEYGDSCGADAIRQNHRWWHRAFKCVSSITRTLSRSIQTTNSRLDAVSGRTSPRRNTTSPVSIQRFLHQLDPAGLTPEDQNAAVCFIQRRLAEVANSAEESKVVLNSMVSISRMSLQKRVQSCGS